MKFNLKYFSILALSVVAVSCGSTVSDTESKDSVTSPGGCNIFQPDSASIAQNYTIPEWFSDAKFGIFIHWGVYSVPAYGEWYARTMYCEGTDTYNHHVENYGHPSEFGYKDFVPMFKAEEFDAAKWAEVFRLSGAKYVVPVAEHHDGFAMYDSPSNMWNAAKMGPKKDIVGELAKAIKAEGLHFGLSSHKAEHPWFFTPGLNFDSDVKDRTIFLYGERIPEPSNIGITVETGENPGSTEGSRQLWLRHMHELIDQYQPELLWFDWCVGKEPFIPTFYEFMAYYYNSAKDWGKEVVVNTKVGFGDNIQVFDIERGKSDEIRPLPWQTDTSIDKGAWGYRPDQQNKTPDHIVDDLVDIVSKNGNMLLNIGPDSKGNITQGQIDVLLKTGEWLKVNGEAIYGTRPWKVAGEGDNKGTAGYMTDGRAEKYNAQDIRFTTKGDALYAISLAWSDEPILIKSLASGSELYPGEIKSVSMVGSSDTLEWRRTSQGLEVTFPKDKPSDYAHVLKIQ